MRTVDGWFCDTRNNDEYPGCTGNAIISWFCTVEGRGVDLCNSCSCAWRQRAKDDEGLRYRCPLCAHIYLAFHNPQAVPSAATAKHAPGSMLTGDLADALDLAMFSEGLLIDVRQRVLARLGADERIRAMVAHA